MNDENIIMNLDGWVNKYNVSKEVKDFIVNEILIKLYSRREKELIVIVSNEKLFGYIKLKIDLTKDQIITDIYETSQLLLHRNVDLEEVKIEVKSI